MIATKRPWIRQAVLSVSFLTILPTPRLIAVDDDMLASVVWWPIVGALLGLGMWAATLVLRTSLPILPTAAIVLGGYTAVTGGLHLDGLMDTFDAIGSRARGHKALAIMKDSRVGAMGVLAGCLVLIAKFAALCTLPAADVGAFVVVPAFSRLAMVGSMPWWPAAASSGLGATFAGKVPARRALAAALIPLFLCLLLLPVDTALVLILCVAVLTFVAGVFLVRRFGGMTGDTYGALHEWIETMGWLVVAAHLH